MRRFENENFPYHLAEGIENFHLTVPDDEAQNALFYIRQFVYRNASTSELTRGYIPENYLDALVRIRDASDNRDFNSAVEQLGVAGATSEEVTEYDEVAKLEVENSFDAEQAVSEIPRENNLDEEVRKNLYSIRELIEDNREPVLYYAPREIIVKLMPYLDEKGILL